MEKSYDERMQDAKKIYEKYAKTFQSYGIHSFEEMKISALPDYLAERFPEKYGPDSGNYMNYKEDENLNEVYAFDSGEGEVYFFGTDDALIKGHIANENLKDGKITLSKELSEKTVGAIFANDPKKIKEFEENFFHGKGKDLEVLEHILEKRGNFAKKINETKNEIDPSAPDIKFNEKENVAEKKSSSKKIEEEDITIGGDGKSKKGNEKIPEDVVKACALLGITNIKGYVYGNAQEFVSKTDAPNVNKHGGNVLIIKVNDDSKNTDKYFVFQDNKLCVPGNRDEDMDKIARKTTQNSKDGTLMKPIKIDDEEQYVEYSDSQGLVIKEKLEENINLSTKKLQEYQQEIQEELEKYSENIYKIEQNNMLSDEQKDQMYMQVNETFNKNNREIALQYGIEYSDVKAINLATDKQTNEQINENEEEKVQEETEAWEVPGKRKRGE